MISVIIPVYKVEKYIKNCIDSVINQTYKEIEIILVDDGSPDECGAICDEYARKDGRIIVIHKTNGGLSDARNAGLDIAKGEYIIFVDSDDFIASDMIEVMMGIENKTNADIIEINSIMCDEKDEYKDVIFSQRNNLDYVEIINDDKMISLLSRDGMKTTSWGKLYNYSLFEEISFPYGKLHEDVFTTYKLVHKANKIVLCQYVGYAYRKNNQGIMRSSFSEKRFDAVNAKIEQMKFIREKYPYLNNLARMDIICACNACLLGIAKSNYRDVSIQKRLQSVYREYGCSYIHSNNGFTKKAVCLLAMIHIRFTIFIIKNIYKYTGLLII